MIIDATYDASGNSAPSGFKSAVADAIAYFEDTFSTAITVTITFSWSALNGSLGQSLSQVETDSYQSVVKALSAHNGATGVLGAATFPANDPFPSTDPAQSSPTLDLATAEARALGLDTTAPASDGTVVLGSGLPWTFGATALSGDYSAISALEHEIAEVLGRQAGSDGSLDPTPMALYRYSSPGVIDTSNSTTGAYFSVDGGVHEVNPNGTFAAGSGGKNGYALGETQGDIADWGTQIANDSFGYGFLGESGPVSSTDLLVMQALGYRLAPSLSAPSVLAPVGSGVGDVHIVTFDGLHYDFQADGDYVLARSTAPGGFEVQIATTPSWGNNAASLTTGVGARVGSDVLTFIPGVQGSVLLNGVADTALNADHPVQTLAGGELIETSATSFAVVWSKGEVLTVKDEGGYFNTSFRLASSDGPGSVQGLLGSDGGIANDFQLPDGTVLAQPLTLQQILGEFAQAWSVPSGDNLLSALPMADNALSIASGVTISLGGASADTAAFQNDGAQASTLVLTAAQEFSGSIVGLLADDSLDLVNFDYPHSSIVGVDGTGAEGTFTNVTITDADPGLGQMQSVTLHLLNLSVDQYGLAVSDYQLGPDGSVTQGTSFQLVAHATS